RIMRDLRSAKTRFAPPDRKHDAAWNPKALLDPGKHLRVLPGARTAPVHNAADGIEIGAWGAELRLVLAAAARRLVSAGEHQIRQVKIRLHARERRLKDTLVDAA